MSQTVGEGVDLVQQRSQSIDGGTKERKDEGFPRGDVLVELPVGREGIRIVDTQLNEGLIEEVPHVNEVLRGGSDRGWSGGGYRRGGEAEALGSIMGRHCSSLGVRRGCSSLRVLSRAAHRECKLSWDFGPEAMWCCEM